jgi:amino-acid N-acetyltransferase
MKIRPAKVSDVKAMHSLIGFYAEKKEMLARSLNDLYENIQELFVVENKGKVIGCCALHVSWEDLAEIKALAIDHKFQKKGLGTKLVVSCEKKAKTLGINKIFTLTFKPGFFTRLDYKKIPKEQLPHKIWGECVKCPYFPDCGEVPLIKTLE